MQMSTNYRFMDELNVNPIQTLGDGARGLVRVVLIGTFDVLNANWPCDAYLTDDEKYDAEMKSGAWYGLRYLNEKDHADWGVVVVPESLLDDMIVK